MREQARTRTYKRHRFPPEVISHAVWLYFRFALRYRDVEELLAERGVVLTDETVRQWCRKFGQQYANTLRRRRPRPGATWHLDEVFVTINGRTHYRWRAVDQDGTVLAILVQPRRDQGRCQEVLSPPAQGPRLRPARHHQRHAGELRRGRARRPPECGASAAQGPQQPR